MKKFFSKAWSFFKKVALIFFTASILSVILFRFVPVPVTPLMIIRLGQQMLDQKPLRLYKDWVPYEEISSTLPLAVMTSEDQRFKEHWGFDFAAIEKAIELNQKSKKKKWGASTISQQTAKNVFLWPGRSWIRKGFEVYFTTLIEIFWSKKHIMEVYLNVIEMGDGIYGAEAASQYYFKKPAKKLSLSQSALIAAVLPNPRRWTPARPTPYIRAKQNWIIRVSYKIKPYLQFD